MRVDFQAVWKMRLSLLASLLLASCGSETEPAVSAGPRVLVKVGLVGHWAVACSSDHSSMNPHLVYEVPTSGLPTERLLMDTQHDRVTPLEDVKELANGLIEWTQTIPGGRVTVLTKVERTRHKTWTSTLSDGTVLISGGRFGGGGETPWFNRCTDN